MLEIAGWEPQGLALSAGKGKEFQSWNVLSSLSKVTRGYSPFVEFAIVTIPVLFPKAKRGEGGGKQGELGKEVIHGKRGGGADLVLSGNQDRPILVPQMTLGLVGEPD